MIPLDTAKVRFTTPDGKSTDSELAKDSAMYSPAGTHNPKNIGTAPMSAILVEFKGAAPGKATFPASRPGMRQAARRRSLRRGVPLDRVAVLRRTGRGRSTTSIRW